MNATLRLDACGDFLTLAQYCAWRGEASSTVRRQIKLGTCFVVPCEERPRLKWRRADCEKRMASADVVRARQQRAKTRAA